MSVIVLMGQKPVTTTSYIVTTISYIMTTTSYIMTTTSYIVTTKSYIVTTISSIATTISYIVAIILMLAFISWDSSIHEKFPKTCYLYKISIKLGYCSMIMTRLLTWKIRLFIVPHWNIAIYSTPL